jgi:acetyl esterase/lipase
MTTVPAVDPEVAERFRGDPMLLKSLKLDDLPRMRAAMLEASRSARLSGDVERTDVTIPGLAGNPAVVMRLHRPKDLAGPLPCLFTIHGGGYLLGSYEVEDQRLDAWVRRRGVLGVSVDYRLSPESAYPDALDDCHAGLRWVCEHAAELSVDPRSIGVMGTSAGGGLAAALALRARDHEDMHIAFQLLAYAMIDDRAQTPSSRWGDVPVWGPRSNELGWRSYLGELYGTDRVPAEAAMARAEDLTGLPPTYLAVGAADVVCDEDIAFAQRLNHCGVPVDLRVYAGGPHGLDRRATDTALSRRARRDMLDWLTSRLGPR